MKPKRKAREWYAVVSRFDTIHEACLCKENARNFCRQHNAEPICGKPFRVIKVREVLAKRGKKK